MQGPCAKQTVTATIVTESGKRYVGTNYVRNHQPGCPRGDMPTGVGYELCVKVCDQVGHAERVAVDLCRADDGFDRVFDYGVCYIEGHSYACERCRAALASIGICDIRFEAPPK